LSADISLCCIKKDKNGMSFAYFYGTPIDTNLTLPLHMQEIFCADSGCKAAAFWKI
jgi:hypothetical protein